MEENKQTENVVNQKQQENNPKKNKKQSAIERLINEEQAAVIEKNFRKSAYFLKIMNILIIIEIVLSIFAVILLKSIEASWLKILVIVVLSVVGGGIVGMFTIVLILYLNLKKYLKSINVDYKELKKALKS